jgi:pimeloyl-ACP methyl ester carboxylesterase
LSIASIATSRDGTPIAFERTGSGPPLILIEPAGHYRALSAFDDLLPLLASDFSVCRYDRRGRGESGDTPPYLPEREVEDLAALVEAHGGQAFLYGYSSGALLGLHAAARGVSFGGMVLLEPPLQDGAQDGPDPLTGELDALIRAGRGEDAVAHFHAAIGVPGEIVDGMRGTRSTAMRSCWNGQWARPLFRRGHGMATTTRPSRRCVRSLLACTLRAARPTPICCRLRIGFGIWSQPQPPVAVS